jgi:hypothetical protein
MAALERPYRWTGTLNRRFARVNANTEYRDLVLLRDSLQVALRFERAPAVSR